MEEKIKPLEEQIKKLQKRLSISYEWIRELRKKLTYLHQCPHCNNKIDLRECATYIED